jgi:hypothetical protein
MQVPGVPMMPAGIKPPVKVTVFTPTVTTPPQLVKAFGVPAITAPMGKVSVNGAVKAAELVFGLVRVMVRVETPP